VKCKWCDSEKFISNMPNKRWKSLPGVYIFKGKKGKES
jgi:hypothetical protein